MSPVSFPFILKSHTRHKTQLQTLRHCCMLYVHSKWERSRRKDCVNQRAKEIIASSGIDAKAEEKGENDVQIFMFLVSSEYSSHSTKNSTTFLPVDVADRDDSKLHFRMPSVSWHQRTRRVGVSVSSEPLRRLLVCKCIVAFGGPARPISEPCVITSACVPAQIDGDVCYCDAHACAPTLARLHYPKTVLQSSSLAAHTPHRVRGWPLAKM
jgi:hypothetical protein